LPITFLSHIYIQCI